MKYQQRPRNQESENELIKSGTHPLLARLLASRGVSAQDQGKRSFADIPSPLLMQDFKKASLLVAQHLMEGSRITVSGDFDTDGASSCAVVVRALKMFLRAAGVSQAQADDRIRFKVPNRFTDGYGLTPGLVDKIMESDKPDLIITVDNGISSHAGIDRANDLGASVLVTDHHLQAETLPNAAAILNPNRKDCTYPSKAICGCAVAFFLMQGVRSALTGKLFSKENRPDLAELLDIVSLATVADVVSLNDKTNRILVALGLNRIRQGKAHAGIKALFEISSAKTEQAVPTDFGFKIASRINAAGRLDDMTTGIRILLTDDMQEARLLAAHLNQTNDERKKIEGEIKRETFAQLGLHDEMLAGSVTGQDSAGIVVHGENFHHGVIGIVASRIKDKTNKPVMILAPEDDPQYLRGSGRSIPGVHLRDVLDYVAKKNPNALHRYGGHAAAAGCVVYANQLESFKTLFSEGVLAFAQPGAFDPITWTDGSLHEDLISVNTAKALSEQVWGQGFAPPLFHDEFEVVSTRLLKEAHTKMVLKKGGITFNAIKFQYTAAVADRVEMTYTLEVNSFDGQVQLMAQEILGRGNTPNLSSQAKNDCDSRHSQSSASP